MLTIPLLIVLLPAQTPGSAEVDPAAPLAAEPLASEVAPTAAEAEAAGMPQPSRARSPRPGSELRAAPSAAPVPPPRPSAPPMPRGQLRPPPSPRLTFIGVTPYVDGRPVGLVSFYAEIGRYDLVEEYQSNKRLKRGLLIGGAAGFGASLVGLMVGYLLWIEDLARSVDANNELTLFTDRGGVVMLISVGAGIGSLVCAAIGVFMDPQPISSAEARELSDTVVVGQQRPPMSWRLAPIVTEGGGGLALSVSF